MSSPILIEKNIEETTEDKIILSAPRPLWLEFALTFLSLSLYSCFWFVGRAREFNHISNTKELRPWAWFFVPIIPIAQVFALPIFVNFFNDICNKKKLPKWKSWFYLWVAACVLTTSFFKIIDHFEIPAWTFVIGLFTWSFLMTIAYSKVNRLKVFLTRGESKEYRYKISVLEWIFYIPMAIFTLFLINEVAIKPLAVVTIEDLPHRSSYIDPGDRFDFPIKDKGWSIVENGSFSEDESELELKGPIDNMFYILRKYEKASYSIDSLTEFQIKQIHALNSTAKCNEKRTLAISNLSLVSRIECKAKSFGDSESHVFTYIENDKEIFELYGYFYASEKLFNKYLNNFKVIARGFEPL